MHRGLHVGGRSALELHGYGPYLSPGAPSSVILYTDEPLPSWLHQLPDLPAFEAQSIAPLYPTEGSDPAGRGEPTVVPLDASASISERQPSARPRRATRSDLAHHLPAESRCWRLSAAGRSGCVYGPEVRDVQPIVEQRFGYPRVQLVSFPDLYAGKHRRPHPPVLPRVRTLVASMPAAHRSFLIGLKRGEPDRGTHRDLADPGAACHPLEASEPRSHNPLSPCTRRRASALQRLHGARVQVHVGRRGAVVAPTRERRVELAAVARHALELVVTWDCGEPAMAGSERLDRPTCSASAAITLPTSAPRTARVRPA